MADERVVATTQTMTSNFHDYGPENQANAALIAAAPALLAALEAAHATISQACRGLPTAGDFLADNVAFFDSMEYVEQTLAAAISDARGETDASY